MTEVDNVQVVATRPVVGVSQGLFLAHRNCLEGTIRRERSYSDAAGKERRRAAEGTA